MNLKTYLRRTLATLLTVFLVASITTTGLLAASVHFKQGSPQFADLCLILRASGALAGLGNGDVVIQVSATGRPTATCTNPAGATQPAGQNPAEVTLTGVGGFPAS